MSLIPAFNISNHPLTGQKRTATLLKIEDAESSLFNGKRIFLTYRVRIYEDDYITIAKQTASLTPFYITVTAVENTIIVDQTGAYILDKDGKPDPNAQGIGQYDFYVDAMAQVGIKTQDFINGGLQADALFHSFDN